MCQWHFGLYASGNAAAAFQLLHIQNGLQVSINVATSTDGMGRTVAVLTFFGSEIDQVLEMVELWDRRRSVVSTYSGGMKRRLEIARGLLHSPRVLFLDEPTVGLDPQTRAHIWNYIEELRRRESITIFLTTHYMDEAEHCDRIAIIDHGRIVAIDTPEVLKSSVGRDRIELRTEDDSAAMAELRERLGLEPTMAEGAVRIYAPNGDRFIPTLFADLSVPILSVSLAQPTLDDVFMSYTGRTIRDSEASNAERLASNPFIRRRMGARR